MFYYCQILDDNLKVTPNLEFCNQYTVHDAVAWEKLNCFLHDKYGDKITGKVAPQDLCDFKHIYAEWPDDDIKDFLLRWLDKMNASIEVSIVIQLAKIQVAY